MELFGISACLLLVIGAYINGPTAASRSNDLKEETSRLINEIRNGKREAFDRLVELYQTKLYNFTFNYLKHPEEAKDLTQDIFVSVYRSLSGLKDVSKFSSWLYQIALNHCRNRYKKLKRTGYFNSQSIDDPESYVQLTSKNSPENQVERQEVINIVRTTISKMKKQEKEVLMLRDMQELSYEEISAILGIPIGTVKSKLNRARTGLKNRLKHYF